MEKITGKVELMILYKCLKKAIPSELAFYSCSWEEVKNVLKETEDINLAFESLKKIFRDVLFVDIVDDFEVDFSLKVNICGIITGNKNLLNDTVKKVLNEGLESSIINEVN